MSALDLLFVVAAVPILLWLVGLIAFNHGTLMYVLLVIAVIIIVVRPLLGNKVQQNPNSNQRQ
jgi:hypothetical protein